MWSGLRESGYSEKRKEGREEEEEEEEEGEGGSLDKRHEKMKYI